MATVKNTIAMKDRMTPVLRTIISAMQSTVTAMASVDNVSNKAFTKAQADVQRATEAVNEFKNTLSEVPGQANRATRSFNGFRNPLVSAASAIYTIQAGLQGISQVTGIADNFVLTNARLDLMNDGLQTTADLQDYILASADRSKAAYDATASSVAKLGLLAGDQFKSTKEIVAFTELMNKSFKIGGASIEEQTSAMYQLTQAMAAGKLQGDEFRSIMENAPMLAQAIADYTGKTKGQLKEMSKEGTITSDIIRGAVLSSADEINKKFSTMPDTVGSSFTTMKNDALEAFQPVIEKIESIVNSPGFDEFSAKVIAGIQQIATWTLNLIGFIQQTVSFVQQNWGVIGPILSAVVTAIGLIVLWIGILKAVTIAASIPMAIAWMMANWPLILLIATIAIAITMWNRVGTMGKILIAVIGAIVAIIVIWIAVQQILNVALTANPIGLIIMAVAALIAIIIAVVAWVINLWKTNMDFKYGIIGIWNKILNFFDQIPIFFQWVGNGIADAFGWAKTQVLDILQNMANGAIGIINDLIGLLNKIPGVAIDPIGELTFATEAAAEEEAAKTARASELAAAKEAAAAKAAKRQSELEANRAIDEKNLAEKQAKAEAEKKSEKKNKAEEPDWSSFTVKGGKLDSVGKIDDDVKITDEDLKYLKDIASTEFVNKYTTLRPELKVTFGDVRETADVNQMLAVMEDMVESAYISSLVTTG